MERKELYKAVISYKDEDIVVEGELVGAELDSSFILIGNDSKQNLRRMIYGATYFVTRALHVVSNISPLKAMDRVMDYTDKIMAITEDELRKENVTIPEADKKVLSVQADYAIGVSEKDQVGNGYPAEKTMELLFKSIVHTSTLILVKRDKDNIEDIYNLIEMGMDTFKNEYFSEEEKDNCVIVSTIAGGRRSEIEGYVASILTPNGVGLIGDTYKYNLAELAKGAVAAIGSLYLDRGVELEKVEASLNSSFEEAMKLVREKAEYDKNNK